MRTLDQLSALRHIGDILAFFGIADSAGIVGDHGGRVLGLWAREVASIDGARPVPAEAELLRRYEVALRAAYDAVARPARRGARGWYVVQGGAAG
jgi:hypothetical protein